MTFVLTTVVWVLWIFVLGVTNYKNCLTAAEFCSKSNFRHFKPQTSSSCFSVGSWFISDFCSGLSGKCVLSPSHSASYPSHSEQIWISGHCWECCNSWTSGTISTGYPSASWRHCCWGSCFCFSSSSFAKPFLSLWSREVTKIEKFQLTTCSWISFTGYIPSLNPLLLFTLCS